VEGFSPPLKCLIEMHSSIQNGEAIRAGIFRYLQNATKRDEFASQVRSFLFLWEQGRDWRTLLGQIKSPYRRALIEIVANGLQGQSILSQIEDLRAEIVSACDLEIRHHIEMMPLKMLVPLLIFQFPAFLVLMFGPLLRNLLQELHR